MKNKLRLNMLVIIAALIAVLASSVGVAVAYIVRETPGLENEFTPVEVAVEVSGMDSPNLSGVSVKNTGDVKAYIRISVVAVFIGEGGEIHADAPVLSEDYSMELDSDLWQKGSDGFYYYVAPVGSGQSTESLFRRVLRVSEPPSGYKLSISVYASGVQAEPSDAVLESWGVGVLGDGKISVP